MSTIVDVGEQWHGDTPVVSVDGEVDASNVHELAVKLRNVLTNRSHGMIVDLTRTVYLDSAGINLLFNVGAELAARQQRLLLVLDGGSPIARMVSVSGLDATYAAHGSLEEALAAVAAR